MSEQDDPRLAVVVAGRSVGAHLDRAIEAGVVIRYDDGGLGFADGGDSNNTVGRNGGFIQKTGQYRPPCTFLNRLLFEQAYAEAAVPIGCRNCYKIKVASGSLRQLMKMKDIAEASGYTTKSGSEVDNPTNSQLYNTYLYFDGLDQARRAYPGIRESIDRDPALGGGVVMTIKRGCSNYERKCGPSDQYAFDPNLEAVESYLLSRFAKRAPRDASSQVVDALRVLRMVETAFRIGDETYKDFTDGQPLYPPLVSYSPEPEAGTTPGDPPA
jgi:hypothetical protein